MYFEIEETHKATRAYLNEHAASGQFQVKESGPKPVWVQWQNSDTEIMLKAPGRRGSSPVTGLLQLFRPIWAFTRDWDNLVSAEVRQATQRIVRTGPPLCQAAANSLRSMGWRA